MLALPSAVSDGEVDGVRALRRSDECGICGDPIVGTCKATYPDWIVILPAELQKSDVFHSTDGRIYAVASVSIDADADQVLVKTNLLKDWRIFHLLLPLLVKRRLVCGAPVCELHCAACADRSARERGKAELTRDHREERRRKNAMRKRYQPFEQ
jgi:hypothetical protein